MKNNPICKLLGINLPIIQGGMVWVSGGRLAGAVSEAGGLGLVGAGSMNLELLEHHIKKAQGMTKNPVGINLPLLYHGIDKQIELALKLGVKIFFTSGGSPKKFTKFLKDNGCTVVHVTSTPLLAKKCEDAGVDAVVAEGFEAGGHNGRDEITTLVLIPQVVDAVKIPVIAAGGIGDARGIAASFALGAKGVQIGTRFIATQEASAHIAFKEAIKKSGPGDTMLTLKNIVPVRLLKNKLFNEIEKLKESGAANDAFEKLLGKGRPKLGMLDGDMDEGELEVGQISGMLNDIPTVADLMKTLEKEYAATASNLPSNL